MNKDDRGQNMNQKEIADFLKQLRKSKNMTQRELAKEMHVTPQAVSRWENGNSIPDINTLKEIALLYGISVDEILKAKINEKPETPKPKEKVSVWKYIGVYLGLTISLIGMSFFIVVFNHFILNMMFIIFGLTLSSLLMFLFKFKHKFREYLLITTVLIISTLVLVIPNINNYAIENEHRLQMTESKEILFTKEIGFDTHVEIYDYIFDQYALIYTEGNVDISVFNLTEYHSEPYYTISTNQMIVKDLVVVGNHIYFSTFIEDIPGEFKLYELDFETHDMTLLFESNHILNLFEAFDMLYLTTDAFFDFDDSRVYQLIDQEVVYLYDLDFQIHELSEYSFDYEQKLLISTHEISSGARNYQVAILDYHNFEIDEILLEDLENVYSFQSTFNTYYTYNKYNGSTLYKLDGYDANLVLTHEHVEYFKLLSEKLYLIDYMLYDENNKQIQDFRFYDEDYNKSGAAIFINDGSDNYYAIDNEFIGFVVEHPNEPYTWDLNFTTRLVLYIPSLLLIGLFVTWGQKRKYD